MLPSSCLPSCTTGTALSTGPGVLYGGLEAFRLLMTVLEIGPLRAPFLNALTSRKALGPVGMLGSAGMDSAVIPVLLNVSCIQKFLDIELTFCMLSPVWVGRAS